jgi:DNA-binding protein HU-beta
MSKSNILLTKVDLVDMVAKDLKITKTLTDDVISKTIDLIIAHTAKGSEIRLTGFGTFHKVQRAARDGINPKTKAKIKIPAQASPAFKVGKTFKETVKAHK